MGMTDVACLAATTAVVADVTMTSTLRRTNSAAISAVRSVRPSAQRYSIATVRPSIQPSSCSRRTKAATHWAWDEGVPETRNPMVGSFVGCCARAVSGQAAAPPSAPINSRRLILTGTCPSRASALGERNDSMPRACGLHVREGGMPMLRRNCIDRSGSKPALPHSNMGVCFDLQQRTLSIVFSVAP
jgi:hypothetical protein